MPKYAIDYIVEEQWSVEVEANSEDEALEIFWSGDHDADRDFVQSDVRPDIIVTKIPE